MIRFIKLELCTQREFSLKIYSENHGGRVTT